MNRQLFTQSPVTQQLKERVGVGLNGPGLSAQLIPFTLSPRYGKTGFSDFLQHFSIRSAITLSLREKFFFQIE
jgi:hypothetical protein